MKKAFLFFGLTALLISAGCCRGPLRQFVRGSACNACQPPLSRFWNGNTVSNCENGQCSYGDDAAIGSGTVETDYYNNSQIAPGMTYSDPYGNGSLGTAISPPANSQLPGPTGRNQ